MGEDDEMTNRSDLWTAAGEVFHRTLAVIDVESVVRASLHLAGDRLEIGGETCELSGFKRILVIAIGKASRAMARAVDCVLGDRVTDGLIVSNAIVGLTPERYRVFIGGHPLPNQGSVDAAETALGMLRGANDEETLVIFLISGGGSALFEKPVDDRITLEDLQTINRALVGCGAVIGEMNVVRRFLSAVKGGRLAASAPRPRQVSLYVSDVNSDDLTTVASGPTLPDNSTVADFHRILSRYRLLEQFPPKVSDIIASLVVQDPSPKGTHHLLLDNRRALTEARKIADSDFGMKVEIAEDLVEGDVDNMAQIHLQRMRRMRDENPGRTVCLLSGGEVICPLRGDGQGGRNQEFVLRAGMMLEAAADESLVVLSAGTDGIDGNSAAAGAIADGLTTSRARAHGISPEEHLRNSDSFNFFNRLGDAIITGPTGNNVRDLRILVAR